MADKRISQLVERTDIANNDVLPIVASGATTTNKVTISTIQDWMQENLDVGVTSVGLSMPSAFAVSNSPVTTSGNISVTGAGTVSQYIRGDGSLADFPQSAGGGGASVSYYLNGSVSQGTIGGVAYLEMNKTPVLGAGTDFTISSNGYIASFITDAGDPSLLLIPGGNWNFETYFQASSGGGTPSFYVELYKVDSGGTATLIASNSANPELIAFGTTTTAYFSSLAVPSTTLTLTDRLALRYYVTPAGRTITLHTENSNLCQIITTFTTGLTALNGLTAQVQNFATGTSGSDFNISSSSSTHTFNLPDASATARGVLSTGTQTIAGAKTFSGGINSISAVLTGALNGVNASFTSTISSQDRIQTDTIFSVKHNSTIYTLNGYNSIQGNLNSFAVYNGTKGMRINFPSDESYTYTLPDASGTFALTSNLSSYLPLTGGTLSGALGGTSASFTGDVQSGTRLIAAASSQSIILTPNLGGSTNRVESVGTLPLALVSAAAITMAAGGTTPQITLATTGAVTLTGALNGTSASFTGTVLTSFLSVSGSAGNIGNINSTNANGGYFTWQTSGITIADIGTAQQIFGSGGSDTFGINARGARSLILGTNDTARLTLASTGAATFSSSVTAEGTYYGKLNAIYQNSSTNILNVGADQSMYGGTNSDGGVFVYGNNKLHLSTNSARRLTVDGSGNVGIGTASPSILLQVEPATTANLVTALFTRGASDPNFRAGFANGSGSSSNTEHAKVGMWYGTSGNPACHIGFLRDNSAGSLGMTFNVNNSEYLRIASTGAVAIGATSTNGRLGVRGTTNDSSAYAFEAANSSGNSLFLVRNDGFTGLTGNVPVYSEKALIQYAGTSNQGFHINQTGSTAANDKILFSNGNGIVGYIRTDGSATSYVTASDYRLKEDLQEINGLEKVSALKVYDFKWLNSEDRTDGVIAHELAEVLPYAVSGEKDGEMMQGVDYSKIVPVLIKAIQELKAEIDSLKTK